MKGGGGSGGNGKICARFILSINTNKNNEANIKVIKQLSIKNKDLEPPLGTSLASHEVILGPFGG